MGKLSELYTKQSKQETLTLPLSKDKLVMHRPSYAEVQEIANYGMTMEDKDVDSGVKLSAFVLKLLCDKPDLSQESQVEIENDIKKWEAPDRTAIMPFYNKMLGITEDMIMQLTAESFSQRTKS